jgi:PadR family transcriptional regulator
LPGFLWTVARMSVGTLQSKEACATLAPVPVDGLVSQMRRGALEYCVMALIQSEPRYAFELIEALGRTGLLTTEGTLYPLLSRLRRDGLVKTEWRESTEGPPRRYYELTAHGRRALSGFKNEWTTFRGAVDGILQEGSKQ